MAADIDAISEEIRRRFPLVEIKQLRPSHPADDDGIWFFRLSSGLEVQLESSTGSCPFLIESDQHPRCMSAETVRSAVQIIVQELGLD